jgi:hypothetical protein
MLTSLHCPLAACSDECLPALAGMVCGAAGTLPTSASAVRALQLTLLSEQLAQQPGLWHGVSRLTQLTRLELGMPAYVYHQLPLDRMRAVLALPALRSLRLGFLSVCDGDEQTELELQLLAQLTGLERLQLCALVDRSYPMPALAALTQLTCLQLTDVDVVAANLVGDHDPWLVRADLSGLPTSLVELQLPTHLGPVGWGELPQLRHLVAPCGL